MPPTIEEVTSPFKSLDLLIVELTLSEIFSHDTLSH